MSFGQCTAWRQLGMCYAAHGVSAHKHGVLSELGVSDLPTIGAKVPAMTGEAVENVRALQASLSHLPQVAITTQHVLHGGVYARTVTLQPGVLIVGVLVKVPTTLVINGDVSVYLGEQTVRLSGYSVIPASAHRKQAFYAHAGTTLTMILQAPGATTIESAEDIFTDEGGALVSRHPDAINEITITGE